MNRSRQDIPVTDFEISLKRLGGDKKLLMTLAGFFLEDAPCLMRQLEDALHSGDLKLLALRVHSLKGLSSTFEALPFRQVASEIELLARPGNEQLVEQKLPQLKMEFDRLVLELQSLAT